MSTRDEDRRCRVAARRRHHGIPFAEAVRVWVRVAALSFGGPAGQIAVMHRILVEEKRWIGENRFLHALNYCMLLPGPEAQQLAIYIGWLLHRTKGGLVAGTLFILPGFLVDPGAQLRLCRSSAMSPLVDGLFFGLKAAVLAIVLQAVLRIGKRALKNRAMVAIAAASFVAIFFFGVPFPLDHPRRRHDRLCSAGAPGSPPSGRRRPWRGLAAPSLSDADSALGEGVPAHASPDVGWSLRISAIFLALVARCRWSRWSPHSAGTTCSARIALFFSQMAVVTFGGAYAVLAYVAQQAVETYGWLRPGEMLDGLGMAETTPGPLIMVVQFVGFLGAYRDAGGLDPLLAATLGAVLTTWVTFVPCFLWIFLGAPFIERLRGNAGALRRAVGDHGRRRRRDPQPRDLVRAARAVRHRRGDPRPRPDARRARSLQRQLGRDRADGGGDAGHIQVRRIDGLGAGRLRAGGNWSQDDLIKVPAASRRASAPAGP